MIRHPTVHALIDGIAVFEIRALEAQPCMDRLHVPEATGGATCGYREIASLRQDRRESAILPISIAIRDGRAAHRMERLQGRELAIRGAAGPGLVVEIDEVEA